MQEKKTGSSGIMPWLDVVAYGAYKHGEQAAAAVCI